METEKLDITGEHAIKRGTTRRLSLTFLKADDTPVNLTGVSAIAKISKNPGTVALTQFTPNLLNPAQGILELVLGASQSQQLKAGYYFWDLYLTLQNGDVVCPLQGNLEIMERTV